MSVLSEWERSLRNNFSEACKVTEVCGLRALCIFMKAPPLEDLEIFSGLEASMHRSCYTGLQNGRGSPIGKTYHSGADAAFAALRIPLSGHATGGAGHHQGCGYTSPAGQERGEADSARSRDRGPQAREGCGITRGLIHESGSRQMSAPVAKEEVRACERRLTFRWLSFWGR
jgi:hypothetical protein